MWILGPEASGGMGSSWAHSAVSHSHATYYNLILKCTFLSPKCEPTTFVIYTVGWFFNLCGSAVHDIHTICFLSRCQYPIFSLTTTHCAWPLHWSSLLWGSVCYESICPHPHRCWPEIANGWLFSVLCLIHGQYKLLEDSFWEEFIGDWCLVLVTVNQHMHVDDMIY